MRNRYKDNKMKKFTNRMQAKLLLVFCILVFLMMGLVGRLVFLNRTDGKRYAKKVLSQQTYTSTVVPFQRGSILDRKGTVLAVSEKVYNIILDVKFMLEDEKYLTPTVDAISSCYKNLTKEKLMDIVKKKPDSRYIILDKGISYDDMMKFKKKEEKNNKIKGVWFEEDYVRKYPFKTLASSVVGFTSSGNVGNWGIEQYYNDQLNGTNGIEYGYIGNDLKLERTVKPAINGYTIISTIDANVQEIVQNHIKTFLKDFGCNNIGVIVMNPNNGEILAMASNEEYDLNNPTDLTPFYTKKEIKAMSEKERLEALNKIWRNYAISDTYSPGSTFKPFTIAAALDESKIHPNDTYICDGSETINGVTIHCAKRSGHGKITLTQAIMVSCNDALMQIAAKEGRNLFYDYQKFYGFGAKTGIDLPGEAVGILVPKEKLSKVDLANSSFGQTFTATMIQMASGFSSLINGGYYYEPHIVKQIQNANGATVQDIDKILVKETVSSETSKFLRNALYQTVQEGSAKSAQVTGYKIGGKTGTAQKPPYSEKKYLVSFLGCVPTDNPEAVVYVVIDVPENVPEQTSAVATKFAGDLMSEILPFLEIYPTEKVDENSKTAAIPVLPGLSGSNNTKKKSTETNKDTKGTLDTIEDSQSEENKADNSNQDTIDEENTSREDENTVESDNEDSDFNPDFIPPEYGDDTVESQNNQ